MLKSVGVRIATVSVAALGAPTTASAGWVEATSDHFIVYGEMKEADARTFAERLERMDTLLRLVTSSPDTGAERANKVTVFVVPDMGSVQRLYGAGGGDIGGFYRPDAQGSLAVTPRSLANLSEYMRPQEILFHEYAHAIFVGGAKAAYPRWLNEGLAEFFGTVEHRPNGDLVLGGLPLIRGFALAAQNQMTTEELLTADRRRLNSTDVSHLYARGWALVHMLMLNKARAGQLDAYIKSVSEGMPSLEAGQKAFGDLRQVDSDLRIHLRARKFPSILVPASRVMGGRTDVRALTACEQKIMPIRIRSAVGVNDKNASTVALSARSAAVGCEQDAFVQRTLAETEYDAKNERESAAAADRALSVDPANVMAMVYKGRVHARAGDWANARKWLIRANRLNPDYALPLVLYHDSFTQAKQPPSASAQNGLLRALVLVPQDAAVRMRVVRAMILSGDMVTARAALAPLALSPHAKTDAPPAKILRMIDENRPREAIIAEMASAKWGDVGKF